MSQENVEIVRGLYTAFVADPAGWTDHLERFDPAVEWHPAVTGSVSGRG
jgi:hypothetical protein